jgi:hypothetical protein
MSCSFSDLIVSGESYDIINCTNNKLHDSQVCCEHMYTLIDDSKSTEEEYIDFKNFKYITKYYKSITCSNIITGGENKGKKCGRKIFNNKGNCCCSRHQNKFIRGECVGEQQLNLYCDTPIDMVPLDKITEHSIKKFTSHYDYRKYNIVSSVVYSFIKNILREIDELNQLDLIILDYLGHSEYKKNILSFILTKIISIINELSSGDKDIIKIVNENLLPTFIKHEIKFLSNYLVNISYNKFLEFKNDILNGDCDIDKEYSDKMLINLDTCINKIEEILRKEKK